MRIEKLRQMVKKAAESAGIGITDIVFEHPADMRYGDYSTNAALVAAKQAKQKPLAIAEQIKQELEALNPNLEGIESIEVADPGFINFHLRKEFFAEVIQDIRENFGKNKILAGQKVMVEYTDPNPFKAFHIGHLMSNTIGESIARIIEYHGAKVVRACWQGDVGLHVAKAIWGIRRRLNSTGFALQDASVRDFGGAYAEGSEAYEVDEKAKAEINSLNKIIFEKSDAAVNKLYDVGRSLSLEHFEGIYKILGTKFDYYFFEGKEGRDGQKIVEEKIGRVFENSEGAVVYRGEKHGLHTRVFLTREGLPTYEAKELGLNKAKFEKEPDLDESIIVTANEQSDYFRVVLAAMAEVLPEIAKRTKHLAHGMLRMPGGKMSSRKGNVITGESLIEQVKALVLEKVKEREMPETEKAELAEIVAVGALRYSILRQAIGGDIVFDFDKSISFEGDSGPYLQYSYVRAKSVLQKAKDAGIQPSVEASLPQEWETTVLERLLCRFPEVVERAGAEYEPHYIATFLIELAGAFNSWYAKEQIVAREDAASPYKVALTSAFATTMRNGLWLLGIAVPEKM